MARDFVSASSERLEVANAVVSSPPMTLACWFKADNITAGHSLITIGSSSELDAVALFALGSQAGDPLRLRVFSNSATKEADTTSGYSANTWHHACAVYAATNDYRVFLDGGNKGTNATNLAAPDALDTTDIGVLLYGGNYYSHIDGAIGEVGIWNVALTDAEVAALAAGIRPIYTRPQNLVTYLPLWRDEDEDYVGGLSFTANGTPTVVPHPPIIWSPPKPWGLPPSGAAPTTLTVQDGAHTHSGDSPHLSQDQFLTVADGQHTQTGDSPHLSQDQFLTAQDGQHTQTADNVVLSILLTLVVQDGEHTQTADVPHLSQDQFLSVADGVHTQTADSLSLSQVHLLVVADGEHQHISDGIIVTEGDVLLVRPRANWPFWS